MTVVSWSEALALANGDDVSEGSARRLLLGLPSDAPDEAVLRRLVGLPEGAPLERVIARADVLRHAAQQAGAAFTHEGQADTRDAAQFYEPDPDDKAASPAPLPDAMTKFRSCAGQRLFERPRGFRCRSCLADCLTPR